ncbi:hypothetical protein ACFW7J_05515 [Streptomyces sp. NPDC059525]|uniref:hypothetical protein n=1 Tax=Streptomyces sp. NPDC059525 TaxID=3346857 RepID=UPI0036C211C4
MEMFWNGIGWKGACPAGGGHDGHGSLDFSLPHDVPATPNSQDGWGYCKNCMAMFWNGDSGRKGECPGSTVGHSWQGYPFVLPHLNDVKNVVVTLHRILNDNTGDDPGNGLEISGRFDVARLCFGPDAGKLITLGSFNLFDRPGSDPQEIIEGTEFPVERAQQLMIFPGEFLWITGKLLEQDTFGENDLGDRDIRIPFDALTNTPVDLGVFADGHDQRVIVTMSTRVA